MKSLILIKNIATKIPWILVVILSFVFNLTSCSNSNNNSTNINNINLVSFSVHPSNNIEVFVGSAERVNIVFNNIGNNANVTTSPVTDLTMNLNSLPSGWHSESGTTFLCPTVKKAGNACQANLSFSPKELSENGVLSLQYAYHYIEHTLFMSYTRQGTGIITITYAASAIDRVVSKVSPIPPIVTALNGSSLTTVTFNTQGNNATNLNLNLTTLPKGWTPADNTITTNFTCSIIQKKGNGCQLLLRFNPTTLKDKGTLTLNYTYTTDLGTPGAGIVNITYTTVAENNIHVNGPSQVYAALNGTQTATFIFNTDTGIATNLILDLSILSSQFPGWSSASNNFTCTTVTSIGNGCQLLLAFHPTSPSDTGTLNLPFSYTNNFNVSATSSVSTQYNTTTENNLSVTPTYLSITAPINTISYAPTLTFSVDSGSITNFNIANALPLGFSITNNTCSNTISANNPCYITLQLDAVNFNIPPNGSFQIQYTYTDTAGLSQSRSIPVTYTLTQDSVVQFSPNQIPEILANYGSNNYTIITFTAINGSITNFNYTLSSIPTDLTIQPQNTTCTTNMNLNAGDSCTVAVLFTPSSTNENGTGQISFNYTNNANGYSSSTTSSINFATASSLVATRVPTGNLSSVVGVGIPVVITFTANNGPINSMNFSPNLPSGGNWTNNGTTCGTSLNENSTCQYTITYTPVAQGESGTVNFQYSYTNNLDTTSNNQQISIGYSSGEWTQITNNTAVGNKSITVDSSSNIVYFGNIYSVINSYNPYTGDWGTVPIDSSSDCYYSSNGSFVTALAVASGNVYFGVDSALFGGSMCLAPGTDFFQFHRGYPSNAFYYNSQIYYGDERGNLYSGYSENTSELPTSTVNGQAVDNNGNFYVALGNGTSDGYVFVFADFALGWSNYTQIDSGGSALSMVSDPNGNIYVGWASGVVIKYTDNGTKNTTIFTQTSGFPITSLAWDIYHNQLVIGAYDKSGNGTGYIYAITSNNQTINLGFPTAVDALINFMVVTDTQGRIYAATYWGNFYVIQY